MINAVVVDDEKKGRDLLTKVLAKYCTDVKVVGQAENVIEAYDVIQSKKPDLVFLDIEMPNGNGFELLKKFDQLKFDVIFTTAYDHYAIKAIKYSALDYLLKPIDIDDLQLAVNKVVAKKGGSNIEENVNILLSSLGENKTAKKIAIPDQEGVTLVKIKDIVKCQSSSNYTVISFSNGTSITSTRTLKEYDQMFEGLPFMRIHHSNLINLHHVRRFVKGEGGYVVMSDGSEVIVSRRRRAELMDAIGSI